MKKLISLMLALILCLSLCACGADAEKIELYDKYDRLIDYMEDEKYDKAINYILKKAQQNESNVEPDGLEADLEEQDTERQNQYNRLCSNLEDVERYLADGSTYSMSYQPEGSEDWIWVEGSEALLILRQQLLAMDGYKDTEELAERFVVLDDLLIQTTESWTDALGNFNENYVKFPYTYDTDGRIVKGVAPEEFQPIAGEWAQYHYEYDNEGRIISLKQKYDDTVEAVLNITYNEDGTLATTSFINSGGSTRDDTYIYEEGRLVQQTYVDNYDNNYVINYTYNEEGQLILTEEQEVEDYSWRYVDVTAYTYDGSGRIASKRISEVSYYNDEVQSENYVHEWTYTYEGDRLVSALDTHVGNFNQEGEQTNNNLEFPRTHTYIYGQYCIYIPAN